MGSIASRLEPPQGGSLLFTTMNECLLWEGELTDSELYDALRYIPNNKSPGNDGLTK